MDPGFFAVLLSFGLQSTASSLFDSGSIGTLRPRTTGLMSPGFHALARLCDTGSDSPFRASERTQEGPSIQIQDIYPKAWLHFLM